MNNEFQKFIFNEWSLIVFEINKKRKKLEYNVKIKYLEKNR